jgi:hypothetical protein
MRIVASSSIDAALSQGGEASSKSEGEAAERCTTLDISTNF